MHDRKPFSQACENNKHAILEVIEAAFTQPGIILEIGTGTGQHAVHFAAAMPHLTWQCSDHPRNAELAKARIAEANLPNILLPLAFDVSDTAWPLRKFDGVFSANTAHIMAWSEVKAMFEGVASGLGRGQPFCLYGPFRYSGSHTSDSNHTFDVNLRHQANHMGVRDLDDLNPLASEVGLTLADDIAMPANNRLLVWRKE